MCFVPQQAQVGDGPSREISVLKVVVPSGSGGGDVGHNGGIQGQLERWGVRPCHVRGAVEEGGSEGVGAVVRDRQAVAVLGVSGVVEEADGLELRVDVGDVGACGGLHWSVVTCGDEVCVGLPVDCCQWIRVADF